MAGHAARVHHAPQNPAKHQAIESAEYTPDTVTQLGYKVLHDAAPFGVEDCQIPHHHEGSVVCFQHLWLRPKAALFNRKPQACAY